MLKFSSLRVTDFERITSHIAAGQIPLGRDRAGSTTAPRDYLDKVNFALDQGRITLDGRRLLLLDAFAIGALRTELVESLGTDAAQGLLTRIGYASGARDARSARNLYPDAADYERAYLSGPQLSALEGLVLVEPVDVKMDVARGTFYCEYLWRDSSEGEIHVTNYGTGETPVCWMQVGYACGFATAFMGRPILFREVQCCGMGHETCRVIGKPVDQWSEAERDLSFLTPRAFVNMHLVRETALAVPSPGARGLPRSGRNSRSSVERVMVGISPQFSAACHALNRVAPTNATVLFLGESGVGKEMFARTLYRISPRADKPFVAVNCAAIPESLLEAELFGVEKGAYTGAVTSRPGRFELADDGVLFLDEVGTLSLAAQAKLLRVLQEGEIERVGGIGTKQVDVRVVTATNVNLREAVNAGEFREDLYYRLNVFPLHIPSLRERIDDIPLLMDAFLKRYCAEHGRVVTGFTQHATEAMLRYDWPGNIRELENLIERAVILAPEGGAIDTFHLFRQEDRLGGASAEFNRQPPDPEPQTEANVFSENIEDFMRDGRSLDQAIDLVVDDIVEKANGNVSAAARVLGISRARLDYRLGKRKRST